jgi:DNA-binding response OmpR family regulator
LIADTDLELRERLHSRLLEIDVDSDCVATAGEALEKLESASYGLIVLDVGLAFGGIERVIDRIDRMDRGRRPIVLVLAPNGEAARSLDVEIVQIVLRRPVDVQQLVDLVRNCLLTSERDRRTAQSGEDGRSTDQVTT